MIFIYIWSASLWFVDATFFAEDPLLTMRGLDGTPLNTGALLEGDTPQRIRDIGDTVGNPRNQSTSSEPIDRIGDAIGGNVLMLWTYIELLSGTYAFNVLELAGVHPNFIALMKLVFPVIVAATVIFYITGRQ